MRMGVSFAARKHPVLTTLRDTKAQVTPVGEVALSIPSGTKREVVIIYVRTAPRGVDPASNQLTREREKIPTTAGRPAGP